MLKIPVHDAKKLTQEVKPPAWTAGSPLMDFPALTKYLNGKEEYISGFAALHNAPGRWVSPEQFDKIYKRARHGTPAGLITHLGTRRTSPDTSPSQHLWAKGEHHRALEVLEAHLHRTAPQQRMNDDRDQVTVVGLDLVDEPHTSYQQWLLRKRALQVQNMGYDRRLIARTKVDFLNTDPLRPLKDVLVVAHRVAFELHHDPEGKFEGAKRVDDARLAALVADQILDLVAWGDDALALGTTHLRPEATRSPRRARADGPRRPEVQGTPGPVSARPSAGCSSTI
ncbi:DUF6879 family protein [Streptomyces sp. NPDC057554]|uniref:DUF6879 family protein n=1 Tax=Streptomyces sp. NPDC057554 TaxID=3350538 RepID=UPI0036943215